MPKLTLEAIQKRIATLQRAAEKLKKKDKTPALKQIFSLMRKHDLSIDDLQRHNKSSPAKRLKKILTPPKKVQPKYRDPISGKTWTGRGKTPTWIALAEQAGTPRESFLINEVHISD